VLAGWVLDHEFEQVETILGPLSLAVIVGLAGRYFWRLATWKPADCSTE
jgi:hypothetical protein